MDKGEWVQMVQAHVRDRPVGEQETAAQDFLNEYTPDTISFYEAHLIMDAFLSSRGYS